MAHHRRTSLLAFTIVTVLVGCGRSWAHEARCVEYEWGAVAAFHDYGTTESRAWLVTSLLLSAKSRTEKLADADVPTPYADYADLLDALQTLPSFEDEVPMSQIPRRWAQFEASLDQADIPHVDRDSCDLAVSELIEE